MTPTPLETVIWHLQVTTVCITMMTRLGEKGKGPSSCAQHLDPLQQQQALTFTSLSSVASTEGDRHPDNSSQVRFAVLHEPVQVEPRLLLGLLLSLSLEKTGVCPSANVGLGTFSSFPG